MSSYALIAAGACVLAHWLGCSAQPSRPAPGATAGVHATAGFGGAGSGVLPEGTAGTTTGNAGTIGGNLGGLIGRDSSGSTALPCDVAEILQRRCQSCHGRTPVASVPMALVSWEDLQAQAMTRPELSVHALAAMRVHDAENPMPPTGLIPADELATLDAWWNGGAAAGTDPTCAPAAPDAGAGEPGPPPDSTCYELRAHAASTPGDKSPYTVANQHYACFYFDAPWPDGAQGVYFGSELGDHASSVHHWLLYLDENGNEPDGRVEACSGLHPSSPTMVAGWAPGADNNGLPPDVGMHLSPANRKLLLEIHFYHDGVSAPVQTNAGIKVCTSNKPLPNTATVSFLGSEAIAIPPNAPGSATGTCTPQFAQDIHILRSWPHMHELGTELQTEILRKDGSKEMLGPWKFDFNNQLSFATPVTIHPGDRLQTTCKFNNTTNNPVTVGTGTQSEMCFNFVTAYPAKALVSKNLWGGSTSLTSSATACLQ